MDRSLLQTSAGLGDRGPRRGRPRGPREPPRRQSAGWRLPGSGGGGRTDGLEAWWGLAGPFKNTWFEVALGSKQPLVVKTRVAWDSIHSG